MSEPPVVFFYKDKLETSEELAQGFSTLMKKISKLADKFKEAY